MHVYRPPRQCDGQFMTRCLQQRANGFDSIVYDRDYVRLCSAKLDLALADPAYVEQVADLPYHVPRLSVHDFGGRLDPQFTLGHVLPPGVSFR
jgi:hypothetical protein